ncbi:MAG: VWA domain-containing protein [Pyrinomonadaceae bacterium]
MLRQYSIAIIFSIFLFAFTIVSQDLYSESSPYKPREISKPKEKKIKKEKNENIATASTSISLTPSSEIDQSVTIPVSVFDKKGQFVRGLDISNFSLYIDNEEIAISSLRTNEQPLNMILLIDTSVSMESRFSEIQDCLVSFVNQMDKDVKVMVVEFSSSMKVSALTDNRAETLRNIQEIKIDGDGTSIYKAVETLFQKEIPQIQGHIAVILVTDGVDTTSKTATYPGSFEEAEKSSATIFPIYFDTSEDFARKSFSSLSDVLQQVLRQQHISGVKIKEYELGKLYMTDIAKLSGGRQIEKTKIDLGEELRLRYYLTFKRRVIPGTGVRRQVKIRINRSKLTVRARGSLID